MAFGIHQQRCLRRSIAPSAVASAPSCVVAAARSPKRLRATGTHLWIDRYAQKHACWRKLLSDKLTTSAAEYRAAIKNER